MHVNLCICYIVITQIDGIILFQKYGFRSNPNKSNLTSNHEVNMPVGINRNKSFKEQINLLRKEEKNLKEEKKTKKSNKKNKRKSPRNATIIDSTSEIQDDEISILCEIKRKKTENNAKFLRKIMKDVKNKKHINLLKHSSEFITSVNIEESSNRDSKSTVEKTPEHKLNPNNKISDNTESHTSINTKFSLNNICDINFQKSEHLKINNTYPDIAKEDEIQFDSLRYLKSSKFIDQDKESKITTNILKETKTENHDVPPHVTYIIGNAMDSYNNTMTQRETLTSEEEMDTILLWKMYQSNAVDQPSFKWKCKQEMPITNCNSMQKYCSSKTMLGNIKYVRIIEKPINNHNSQFRDYIIQEVRNEINTCENKEIDYKSFRFRNNNDSITQKHNAFIENDVKTCSNINYIDNGTHYVMPTMMYYDTHAKKRIQCLHNFNDMYTTCNSTTLTEDQIRSSLDDQNINLDNKIKYGSTHSKTAIKPQQSNSDCNTLLSNNRLHPSEHFFSNIDSAFSNVDLKGFNEIMETYKGDLLSDSINISSSDNQIGILEILEKMSNKTTNFFQQSPFELNNVHTNTFLSEKDILCNNQNNAINTVKFDSLAFE